MTQNLDRNRLREIEDSVTTALDGWSRLKLLIAYAYIHRGSGITMDDIDFEIRKEAKREQQEGA